VDLTLVAFFRDSSARVPDESVAAYLSTSASRAGDPIDPLYLKNLQAEALLTSATTAYDDGHYEPALALYRQAAELPESGHQERVYDGLYLTNRARPSAAGRRGLRSPCLVRPAARLSSGEVSLQP
jgi:hypothetical protein